MSRRYYDHDYHLVRTLAPSSIDMVLPADLRARADPERQIGHSLTKEIYPLAAHPLAIIIM